MDAKKILSAASTGAILESISDGVFTVDDQWRVTSFNRAAEDITGLSREEALGRLCSEVFKSSMCESGCPLRRTLENGEPLINRVGFIIDAASRRIPVSVSTAVLRDESGAVIGGAETFRDLSEVESLRRELESGCSIEGFVTHSSVMCGVMDLARAVADTPSTVLIQGETGTGKEVLARAIHKMSSRSGKPFVVINCAALPDSLLESELFGHKRGAFTGADRDREGRFALATGGTIFLDEIGEVSPALQARLLRVLQERTFQPLGGNENLKTDARIICATHRDLAAMVAGGAFREDLFYRINVMALRIPPLRERKEDIAFLARHLLNRINRERNLNIPGITPEVYSLFLEYNWPGNVRELENALERASVLCGGESVSVRHLPEQFSGGIDTDPSGRAFRSLLSGRERDLIMAALRKCNGNRTAAARELGMHKTTLYRKMHKLGIQ